MEYPVYIPKKSCIVKTLYMMYLKSTLLKVGQSTGVGLSAKSTMDLAMVHPALKPATDAGDAFYHFEGHVFSTRSVQPLWYLSLSGAPFGVSYSVPLSYCVSLHIISAYFLSGLLVPFEYKSPYFLYVAPQSEIEL